MIQIANELAADCAVDPQAVAKILDRAAAELRDLTDDDAWPIVQRAVAEMAKLGYVGSPFDEATLDHCLRDVPEPDRAIFREYRSGKRRGDIAAKLGVSKDVVLRSLARTYARLGMRMVG